MLASCNEGLVSWVAYLWRTNPLPRAFNTPRLDPPLGIDAGVPRMLNQILGAEDGRERLLKVL